MSQDALEELRRAVPASCCFLNLRSYNLDPEYAPFIGMALNQHLEQLIFSPGRAHVQDAEILAMLRKLPERCPKLSELFLCHLWSPQPFAEALTEIIPKLRHLTGFMHLPLISAADLVAFATLPRLTYLQCTLDESETPSEAFAHCPSGSPSFPALKTLDLHLHSYEHVLSFLPDVTSHDLFCLSLYCDTMPTLQQIEALFALLASFSSRCPLRELRISASDALDADLPLAARTITLNMLRPLFDLQVEVLSISSFIIDIDDDALEAMATAWPCLRTLNLGIFTGWGARHPPRATIRGLIPLIRHCPDISDIGYRMRTDILDTPPAVGRPGGGVVAKQWIKLHVGDSRIDDAVKVASFLSDICPKLCDIGSVWLNLNFSHLEGGEEEDEEEADEMLRRWNLVTVYVPHFAMVRVQERIFTLTPTIP